MWLLIILSQHVESLNRTTIVKTVANKTPSSTKSTATAVNDYVKNGDIVRPFFLNDREVIPRNVFTPSRQFNAFQSIDADSRAAAKIQIKSHNRRNEISQLLNVAKKTSPSSSSSLSPLLSLYDLYNNKSENLTEEKSHINQISFKDLSQSKQPQQHQQQLNKFRRSHKQNMSVNVHQNEISKRDDLTSDFKSLEDLLVDYVTNFFEKGRYEPTPGLLIELHNNHSESVSNGRLLKTRNVRATEANVHIDVPRTLETGRLLFLSGLKKILWPVFVGLQVLKSLLIAMFIPAIIGSFTRLLGKGISNGSTQLFIRPMEAPQELDFRDNSFNFEDDNNELQKDNNPYAYNQPDASQVHSEYVFDPASGTNQLTFTRLGMNERQHQLMQDSYMSALQSIGSASFKNSGSLSSSSSGLLAPMAKRPPAAANVNTYQQFQNVPDSSLLLSNYDPFYSPLLSRLDSVFAQLKINSDKEVCREKLICLMYANPGKYAPYSNLVSAQLSRELNELRKPTSDNPDILRFFKYMRAAKDGQDGVDCEETFDKCTEFKDFDNPAMVSTYHDINKLVGARKFSRK